MLVSTIFFVLVAGFGAIVYDTRRVLREPLLQYKKGRGIVTLPPLEGVSFDLFLSHAQDLGQDQVATIKGILEKLLPSIKVGSAVIWPRLVDCFTDFCVYYCTWFLYLQDLFGRRVSR